MPLLIYCHPIQPNVLFRRILSTNLEGDVHIEGDDVIWLWVFENPRSRQVSDLMPLKNEVLICRKLSIKQRR